MTHTETNFRSASDLSSAVVVNGGRTYRAMGQYEGAVVELALDNHSLKMEAHEQREAFIAKGKTANKYAALKDMSLAPKAVGKAMALQSRGMQAQRRMSAVTSLRSSMSATTAPKPEAKPVVAKAPAAPTMTIASTQVNKPKRPNLAGRMEQLGATLGFFANLSPTFA